MHASTSLKPCIFRGKVNGDACQCTNTKDLMHGGTVPLELCGYCPFRREPDFFAQTERLQLHLQHSGKYTPQPRACGGCGTFKARDGATQFVWPYWAGGANGDELRFSIRSVEANYRGTAKITIVGDRPAWYRGHVIEQPRIAPCANRPYRDMLAKMKTIATHPEIDAECVWMMDDVYLLLPVTWDDLDVPRAWRYVDSGRNQWQRRKQKTMAALRTRQRQNHDYATHLPHTIEKSKLADLWRVYDLDNNTYLWEVLYGNEHRGRPWGTRPFFARLDSGRTVAEIERKTNGATVLNHYATAWTPAMRQFLEVRFPKPAVGELADVGYRAPVRQVQRQAQRPVKRRPRHTHRAVIEAQKRQAECGTS